MNLSKFLACLMIVLLTFSLAACDDEDTNTDPTTTDTTSGSDTSGTSGSDTSGTSGSDTSGGTSGDTSGTTSGDTSGTTSGDTSGVTTNTIVDIAVGNPDFSTLVAALTAADLVSTLQGAGPFTVFAPPNTAFAKLDPELVADLLKPENKDQLRATLLYHVVAGELDADAVASSSLLTTVEGNKARITTDGDNVFINGAPISTANIKADNGIIHIIDDVIMIPGTLADVVSADDRFTTLLTAVAAAGLVGAVSNPDTKLTVFAPTDDAFAKIPEAVLAGFLEPENVGALQRLLTFHAIPGEWNASQVMARDSFTTLSGFTAAISTSNGPMIEDASIIDTDIPASNGIIHAIDTVIMPPTIGDIVATNPDFSTLRSLLNRVQLTSALNNPLASLTVFAPTNAAFTTGLLAQVAIMTDAEVRDILLYHVVPSELQASEVLAAEDPLNTLLTDESLTITTDGEGNAFVNQSQIIQTDIRTFNGIIHVIDTVLMPSP